MNETGLNIKRVIPTAIHILLCIIILFMPFLAIYTSDDIDYRFFSVYVLRTSVLIIIFYFNYLYLIDRFLFTRKFLLYGFLNLALILCIINLQNVFADFIFSNNDVPLKPYEMKEDNGNMPKPPPMRMKIWGDYMFAIFSIGMSVALKATKRWYKDSINLETIKASRLEADLRHLRSQLNPHFLFNTLNNIYSLIAIDKNKAQESVHRLSSMLRFMLYENDDKFIPLDKELEFTRNYIDLMALRLNDSTKLNVSIKETDCTNKVASLMFITLIENAFKHGIHNQKNSFIDVNIYVDSAKGVLCTVSNSLNQSNSDLELSNSGIGLDNLRKRLDLLYPKRHQLEIKKDKNSFAVLLRIDFETNKENNK